MAKASPEITSKQQLIDYVASGETPRDEWKMGTEHEKFCYKTADNSPLSYEGEVGIKALLEAFRDRFNWEPVLEGDHIIALKKDGASITLEPGGQFELSGALLDTIHQTCDEVHSHLAEAKAIGEDMGVGFIGLGFHPTLKREEIPVMPKGRYDIMRSYMPKKGKLGLDMMLRTSTIQVNLDYASEADMIQKFRVSLALQPIATALFANSPFTEGRLNGFKSMRSQVWTDTDPDRTGMLPFVFDEGFGYERYIDYILDVPMYFVYRDRYIDASGQSFRDFLKGDLPAYRGHIPTIKDFEDHLTTTFPEVRMKKFLEMRGADGGPWNRLCALPAFWVGLLYDQTALDAAWDLVKDWTTDEMQELRMEVPKMGLETPFRQTNVQDIARRVLEISDMGLKNRQRLSSSGETEQGFLTSLFDCVESGKTPADILLDAYKNDWGGDASQVFKHFSY